MKRLLTKIALSPFRSLASWAKTKNNVAQLVYLANLAPDVEVGLSKDQSEYLRMLADYITPSPLIRRKGKTVYMAKPLEEVTLWNVLEARRAETATELIHGWTGDYLPDTISDMLSLSKWIKLQLEASSELEDLLFPFAGSGGEGSGNPLVEAKNVLGMVQITAELFHCSFEDAKNINYTDAVLAISKRKEEVDKQKQELRNKGHAI